MVDVRKMCPNVGKYVDVGKTVTIRVGGLVGRRGVVKDVKYDTYYVALEGSDKPLIFDRKELKFE